MIEVHNLKKVFGSDTVLNIPYLKIRKGKITAVIGPSGSGKSTFMALINGLDKPSEGKIIVEGEEFSASKNYSEYIRKQMTMVFQEPVMLKTTLEKNIEYGLKLRGFSDIKDKTFNIAQRLGIQDKLKQRASTLSGGEASRASLARAMVFEPKLLILDEPTSNLDPQNVAVIENALKHMQSVLGNTIIVVTHNMFQAKRIADDVIFLLDGKVIESGESNKIFENPSDIRTARFISGDMIY